MRGGRESWVFFVGVNYIISKQPLGAFILYFIAFPIFESLILGGPSPLVILKMLNLFCK